MFEVKRDIFLKILENFSEKHILINESRIWRFDEFFEESFQLSQHIDIKPNERVVIPTFDTEILLKSILAVWFKRAVAIPLNPEMPVSKKKELLNKLSCSEYSFKNKIDIFYKHSSKDKLNNFNLNNKLFKIKNKRNKFFVNTKAWGTIIFTSGSSGPEKAVIHSIGNHFYSALGSNIFEPLNPGDRWFLSLPLFHVGGLAVFFRVMLSGATMVTSSGKKNIAEIIKKYKISHLSLVPTQLYRLLQTKDGRDSLKKLKFILLGGAKIPGPLLKQTKELRLNLKTTYGSTEMASQIATGLMDSYKILPYREVRISKMNEIEVRGKTRFLGYFEKGKLTKPFDKNGWFKTGDLGFWDSTKNFIGEKIPHQYKLLKIVGRIDRMFVSGGENILPEEIERALYESNMVEHAIVVSVNDEEFGKRPVVFIKYLGVCSESRIREFLEKILMKFKIPDLFLPWNESFEKVFKNSTVELTKIAQYQFDIWRKKSC